MPITTRDKKDFTLQEIMTILNHNNILIKPSPIFCKLLFLIFRNNEVYRINSAKAKQRKNHLLPNIITKNSNEY